MYKYIFVCDNKCDGLDCKFVMEERISLSSEGLKAYAENLKDVCVQGNMENCKWKFKKEKIV